MIHRARKAGVGGRLSYGVSGERSGSIVAYPAPTAFEWEGVDEGKVVLLVMDNARPKTVLIDALRKNFGLTRAESRVACLLQDGKTSRNIATELGVQINSVRAHLKAVYAKTDTHSQVELLNLLKRESDMA